MGRKKNKKNRSQKDNGWSQPYQRREKTKKTRSKFAKIAIAGLAALVIGTSVYSLKDHSQPTRISAEYVNEWYSHILDEGVRERDIVNHSPTYRELGRRSHQEELGQERDKKFQISGRYEDYDIIALGTMIPQSDAALKRVYSLFNRLYSDQNGLKDIEKELSKIKNMNDEEAFKNILSMSYFMTRSTYKAGLVDVFAEDLEKRMKKGEGDCQTNSAITFFNFLNLSDAVDKEYLAKNIRLAEGFEAGKLTGQGHVWLEAHLDGKWRVISCNEGCDDILFRRKFDPNERYYEQVVLPDHIAREHIKILEYNYRFTGPQEGYTQKIKILPLALEKEMRANNWKSN